MPGLREYTEIFPMGEGDKDESLRNNIQGIKGKVLKRRHPGASEI